MDQYKTCPRCGATRSVADYAKNRRRPDGLGIYCKVCKAADAARRYVNDPDKHRSAASKRYWLNQEKAVARAQTYRDADPEKVREISRASRRREYRRHPERIKLGNQARTAAIKHGAQVYKITPEQLRAKIAYWGGHCWVCHGPYEAIDHVKPLAKSGPHMLANLRPICRSCNSRKNARWPLPALS